jgi:5-methylcytosine-specific restriction endonuclease McrA
MMDAPRFIPEVGDDVLRREKARARELRQSPWWRRRITVGTCHYCRRQVGATALTMDHIVPLIRGGRSVRGNTVPACKDCNSKKQSLLPWEWDEFVSRQGAEDVENT